MRFSIVLVAIFLAYAYAHAEDADLPLGFQPNIVFILTDDQDVILGEDDYTRIGSLASMPNTQQLLMDEGLFMNHFHVSTPICCPSRTETFSGRYYHNIGPPNEPGACMHVNTTNAVAPGRGMFPLMQSFGYQTGVFGKVTNDQTTILKIATELDTMDHIDSPIDYNSYMGLTYWHKEPQNTTSWTETIDKKDPIYGTPYQSTQIGNRTLKWLDEIDSTKPFFAYIGPHAPHFPAQPAPWYEDNFADVTIPKTPNYNASSPGKAQHVAQNPPLDADVECWENEHFRNRWRCLLSVDDIVQAVVDKVKAMGQLDRTVFIYSSDHGYKQGQWRIGTSKQHPYDTDIRVPLLMRGPGIKANSSYDFVSSNVDILPTMIELAAGAAAIPKFVDGHSLVPHVFTEAENVANDESMIKRRADSWRDHILVEYLSVGTYYNDHSSIWAPNSSICATPHPPRGPGNPPKTCVEETGVGNGACYFVDSTHSNSWRAIRIYAENMDWLYVEYDPDWSFNATSIQHYELYDVAKDPYQMDNIYPSSSPSVKKEMHEKLATYWVCGGTETEASNCP